MQKCLRAHIGGLDLRDLIYGQLKFSAADKNYIHANLIEGEPGVSSKTIVVSLDCRCAVE